MDLSNTWQFSLLMYYIFNVIFFQFYKLAVKNVEQDGAATIIFQVIAGLSQLLIIPLFAWQLPNQFEAIWFLLAACIFYAVNDRLQTTVRKNLEVSVFSILSQFGTVFLILYGLIVFREPFVLTKIMGALLIIAANIWILYKPNKQKFILNRYYLIGVVALFAFATAISIDIGISGQFNLPFYITLTLLIPAIMVAFSERIKLKSITEEWERGNKYFYVTTGVSWGLSILFGLRAYQLGDVSTVVPLQAISVIMNVMVAYIFLRERQNGYKKVLAALLAVLGVYLTVL